MAHSRASPGVERTLVVCAGAGLRLQPLGGEAFTVDVDSVPARFAADVPCMATLLDGQITNLNVMSRRLRASHDVTPLAGALETINPRSNLCFIACLAGSIEARAAGEVYRLDADDTLRIEA